MRRAHLAMLLFAAVAWLGLAATAQAQSSLGGGDGGGGEGHVPCACADTVNNTHEDCLETVLCGGAINCTVGGQATCNTALPGSICMDAANGCGFAICAPQCTDQSGCGALHPFGSFPGTPFPLCPNNFIPTLSQWGLIGFGLLLLTAMFVAIRRGNLSMRSGVVGLLAVGLIGVSASYYQIQVNRSCGDQDVAVEFVQGLLG